SPGKPNMPETMWRPCWRNNSGVWPQTAGESHKGSSASCTRFRPVRSSLATSSWGDSGWSDQLQTANRPLRPLFFMRYSCAMGEFAMHSILGKPALLKSLYVAFRFFAFFSFHFGLQKEDRKSV